MNQQIKQRWIAALRSGEYQQVTGKLHNDRGFCCLGVLCDLYAKEQNVEWHKSHHFYKIFGVETILPYEVVKWSNLEGKNPTALVDGDSKNLSNLNDIGYTFEQLAQLIEEQL